MALYACIDLGLQVKLIVLTCQRHHPYDQSRVKENFVNCSYFKKMKTFSEIGIPFLIPVYPFHHPK